MVYRHSLRSHIVKSFCIYGSLLSLCYAVFVFITLNYLEERLEKNFYQTRIKDELHFFLDQYQKDKNTPPPRSPYLTIYLDLPSMPESLRHLVAGRRDGFYEIDHATADESEGYSFLIHTTPETRQTVYLFYDAGFLEITDNRTVVIFGILAVGYILVFFISIWIGRLTSRKIIEPVAYLADMVQKADPDHLPTDLSSSFYHDEVGALALSLEQTMGRIGLFMQREQQFTRNASHELRTPVTVIKGAVEVLKQHPEWKTPGIRPPLLRIERSVSDMEDIIDAFLWLARETDALATDERNDVSALMEDVMAQHRCLIDNKPLIVKRVHEADLCINAPRSILKIVLGNLVKNAFNYTISGSITVTVKTDRVVIEDTGEGIPADLLEKATEPRTRGKESRGFGIGLAIAKMICERFDWRLAIASHPGSGTAVELIFGKQA